MTKYDYIHDVINDVLKGNKRNVNRVKKRINAREAKDRKYRNQMKAFIKSPQFTITGLSGVGLAGLKGYDYYKNKKQKEQENLEEEKEEEKE